jgi:ABC-type Fe3+/spermidine/putrescine transport system ATPase subunit
LMSNPFLQLIEVTKRFGDRKVVDGLSLDVAEGEVLALLGASGSGKTTTLRLIAGLEKPDSGEVWIAGRKVAEGSRNLMPHAPEALGSFFRTWLYGHILL